MIDVIIPAYNAKKTIVRTLASIIIQKNVKKLFVTIVDDCSNESYEEVIDFFKKYVKIQLIRLEKNSGPGVARQVGIDNTNHPFIVFIDSDDEFYNENSVLFLQGAINKFDIAIGSVQYEKENKRIFFNECLHGKMYRRSFLEENNIHFIDSRSHEDNAFNQLCMCICQRIVYIDKSHIIYRYNNCENSIINNIEYVDSMHSYIKCMNWMYEHIDKSEYKNNNTIATVIIGIMRYLGMYYLYDKEMFGFILDDASFLKTEYFKYKQYSSDTPKELSYKEYNIGGIKEEHLESFINLIK